MISGSQTETAWMEILAKLCVYTFNLRLIFKEVKMHYDSFRSIFVLVIQINKYLQQVQALNEPFRHCKTYFFFLICKCCDFWKVTCVTEVVLQMTETILIADLLMLIY